MRERPNATQSRTLFCHYQLTKDIQFGACVVREICLLRASVLLLDIAMVAFILKHTLLLTSEGLPVVQNPMKRVFIYFYSSFFSCSTNHA